MLINEEMKMADVIHLNHHLLHVINRFGIQLGYGEKTVKQLCAEHELPLPFFLEIVNTFHDPSYFPVDAMLRFDAALLIRYLQQTHAYYLEFRIPEIEHYITRLTTDESWDETIKGLIRDFFCQYVFELTQHIKREEDRVYPYVLALAHYIETGLGEKELVESLKHYSIQEYENEHDDVESKLFDLKNIIIKYIPRPKHSRILNLILHELFELEDDLHNHSHIENMILVPIVERMEKEFFALTRNGRHD